MTYSRERPDGRYLDESINLARRNSRKRTGGFSAGRPPEQQRFVADNADVLRDARSSRQSVGERRDVRNAPYRLDFFLLREFFGERDDVHRPPGFHQVHHALKETTM